MASIFKVGFAAGTLALGALSACYPRQERRDALQIAVTFAESIRQGDTATVRMLAVPEVANDLVARVRDSGDARLAFSKSHPNAQFRGEAGEIMNVFIPSVSDSAGKSGVIVAIQSGKPMRVLEYHLVPDLRIQN